jgi:hypothetical protein
VSPYVPRILSDPGPNLTPKKKFFFLARVRKKLYFSPCPVVQPTARTGAPPMISPLRKQLITCADIVDNAKALARRYEAKPDDAALRQRLAFNLRELATEARAALEALEGK